MKQLGAQADAGGGGEARRATSSHVTRALMSECSVVAEIVVRC